MQLHVIWDINLYSLFKFGFNILKKIMQRLLKLGYLKTNIKPRTTNTALDRTYADKALKQTLDFLEATLKGENKAINLKLPD